MMKWGTKKPVSSSSSSKLFHALPVSWFSKLSVSSSNLKPTKEKKQDDVVSHNMSVKSSMSSTKRRNDIHKSKKSFQRVSKSEDMESNEKFEEIMSSVRKKVRDFQRETHGFLNRDNGTVILTPRIQVNRDKQRCQRRDQKLLEEKPKRSEVKVTKPTKPANEWQKLKEMKHREVKLKAEHQRKSLYIKREVNKLGTKEYSKVKVFSPRSFEKCRVKAIEDLKKAKLREVGRMESESFAVVKCSNDPQKDFRDSMIEMIIENGINHPKDLKELLVCYLNLNAHEYHDMIIKVFQQVHSDLNFHYFGAK